MPNQRRRDLSHPWAEPPCRGWSRPLAGSARLGGGLGTDWTQVHRSGGSFGHPPHSVRVDYRDAFARAYLGLRHSYDDFAADDEHGARCREVLQLAPPAQRRALFSEPRYQSPRLFQQLLDHTLEIAETAATEARDLAELTLEAVTHLGPLWTWEALAADLEARCWACLGNTYRLLEELDEAAEAFRIAERRLADGTGDPLEEALVLWLKAQLAVDRCDLDAGELGLDRMIAIATGSQHPLHLARAFLLKAEIWARRGDVRGASGFARTAAEFAAAVDARLHETAQEQLAGYLEGMGRGLEAQRLRARLRLARCRPAS